MWFLLTERAFVYRKNHMLHSMLRDTQAQVAGTLGIVEARNFSLWEEYIRIWFFPDLSSEPLWNLKNQIPRYHFRTTELESPR